MIGINQFPATPTGFELVHRSAIVRLGPSGPTLLDDAAHASVGIISVEATTDNYLKVTTDFDPITEICLSATANTDATLAVKGITVGASGGAGVTLFAISSSKALPYGSAPSYRAAYSRLHPSGGVFNPEIDNLWINFLSIRKVEPS